MAAGLYARAEVEIAVARAPVPSATPRALSLFKACGHFLPAMSQGGAAAAVLAYVADTIKNAHVTANNAHDRAAAAMSASDAATSLRSCSGVNSGRVTLACEVMRRELAATVTRSRSVHKFVRPRRRAARGGDARNKRKKSEKMHGSW